MSEMIVHELGEEPDRIVCYDDELKEFKSENKKNSSMQLKSMGSLSVDHLLLGKSVMSIE